jgi:hypothetical protein
MDRARIAAELPPDMAAWMHAHADLALWDSVGRAVAIDLGRRLLVGDPATNPLLIDVHRTASSPAVCHVAAAIVDGRHRWSAFRVARELIKYLELWSAQEHVQRSLGKSTRPAPLLDTDAAA